MRKSIDGLAALVQHHFKLDHFSSALFVFCGRTRDRINILRWEHNGFWLYYRRLEKGKFHWPSHPSTGAMTIGYRELNWLLGGLIINKNRLIPKCVQPLWDKLFRINILAKQACFWYNEMDETRI